MEPVRLRHDETAPGRPFTDPARTLEDLATLRAMQAALRDAANGPPLPVRWEDCEGAKHWLTVPDPARLREHAPCSAVGFFGQGRPVDHGPIIDLEHEIVGRAADFAGLLAYYNVELRPGRHGNLVVFEDAPSRGHVAGDAVHLIAIERAPLHYHSLRLHIGELPDGAAGAASIRLDRTRYMDFDSGERWEALREPALPG